jgi:hypothetical protein
MGFAAERQLCLLGDPDTGGTVGGLYCGGIGQHDLPSRLVSMAA